jgi:nucleolar GTP-binding protein
MFRIGTVLDADELIDVGFRKASKVNARGNIAKAKVNTAASAISSRLRKVVRSFPSLDRLHPFHRELIDALVGLDGLRHALGTAAWCAEHVDVVARLFRGTDVRQPYGRISSLVKQVRKELEFLEEARSKLEAIPEIDPALPTVIVAGPPNVGKSALVARLSSAKPKVATYPFTTKELHVGHADAKGRKVQIIDTPGLLDRPMEERNKIERQAITALKHLNAVVIFLLDPSETCGYDLAYQERVLEEARAVFSSERIKVVESKGDLARTGKRPSLSAERGPGTAETWKALVAMLDVSNDGRLY